MRHKMLTVTHISEIIESIKHIILKFVQFFGSIVHTQPEYPRIISAAENARMVEIHGKRFMTCSDFLNLFDYFRYLVIGCVADEFKCEMYLVCPAPIYPVMLKVTLQTLH